MIFLRSVGGGLAALTALSVASGTAGAAPVTWEFRDVVLTDGTLLTGRFDYDGVANLYANFDIETVAGNQIQSTTTVPGQRYRLTAPDYVSDPQFFVLFVPVDETQPIDQQDLGGQPALAVRFSEPLPATPAQGDAIGIQVIRETTCPNFFCTALDTFSGPIIRSGEPEFVFSEIGTIPVPELVADLAAEPAVATRIPLPEGLPFLAASLFALSFLCRRSARR
ncbi:MAG: hypothetical protein ACFBSD_03910 [Paracoccaceae bacterium]